MMRGHGEVTLVGLREIPPIQPGDDLPAIICEAALRQGIPFNDGDIIVVTQKIVSKAEGRMLRLSQVVPSPAASALARQTGKDPRLLELILQESRRIVRIGQGVLISETRHGFVCANAGIDSSNMEKAGMVSLLPIDPDHSARLIRQGIQRRVGVEVAIIISDTFGRPWRTGLSNVAIGVAGMLPLKSYVGEKDTYGYTLRATEMAVADELAAAAELVMGKLDQVPVALISGYRYPEGEGEIRSLNRPQERDLFR